MKYKVHVTARWWNIKYTWRRGDEIYKVQINANCFIFIKPFTGQCLLKWLVLTDKNIYSFRGYPREIVQGGTRLLWGIWDRLRLLSKLRVCCPNKPLIKFLKSQSEFYLIIFLNKLKIVENTNNNKIINTKNNNKTFTDKGRSGAPSWLPGPWTYVPAEPPSHRPCNLSDLKIVFTCTTIFFLQKLRLYLIYDHDFDWWNNVRKL
jgi:hypothetical protein